MTTLEGYVVVPALYQQAGGSEAQVGDQIKLYLDTDAQPGFPEFILGVIQHPILRVCDGTSYSVEYDEADLIVAEAIHPDDVVSAEVFQAWDQLGATLEAEIARATAAEAAEIAARTAADLLLVPMTRTINGVSLGTNITLTPADLGATAAAEVGTLVVRDETGGISVSSLTLSNGVQDVFLTATNATTSYILNMPETAGGGTVATTSRLDGIPVIVIPPDADPHVVGAIWNNAGVVNFSLG